MFSHATIGTNDISSARTFYDAIMGGGHQRYYDYEDVASRYGAPTDKGFVIRLSSVV